MSLHVRSLFPHEEPKTAIVRHRSHVDGEYMRHNEFGTISCEGGPRRATTSPVKDRTCGGGRGCCGRNKRTLKGRPAVTTSKSVGLSAMSFAWATAQHLKSIMRKLTSSLSGSMTAGYTPHVRANPRAVSMLGVTPMTGTLGRSCAALLTVVPLEVKTTIALAPRVSATCSSSSRNEAAEETTNQEHQYYISFLSFRVTFLRGNITRDRESNLTNREPSQHQGLQADRRRQQHTRKRYTGKVYVS